MKATVFGRNHNILTLLIFTLFFVVTVHATDFYVSTSGSDSNNGSASAPFKTIQHALDIVGPGGHVIVKAGVYNERLEVKTSGSSGNPIVIEGERGPNGEFLTVIDGGDPVSGWSYASEVGEGVYKTNSINYVPYNMVVDDKQIVRISDSNMNGGGFGFLNMPIDGKVITTSDKKEVKFWDVFYAVYGYKNGYVYIRFKNGDNPSMKNIRSSPNVSVISLSDVGYVNICNLNIRGARKCIEISGNQAHHNIIENNFLLNGHDRVVVGNGASYNTIRDNEMTLNLYGYQKAGAWEDNKSSSEYEYGLKEYIYNFYKKYVGDSASDDRMVTLLHCGKGNIVANNHMYQGLIGVIAYAKGSNPIEDLKVYENEVHGMSSIGFLIMEGLVNAQYFDNLLYNNNINMRFHHLNYDGDVSGGRTVYIYHNWLYNPPDRSTQIYAHYDRNGASRARFYVYHNSFSGSKYGIYFSPYAADNGGLPNSVWLNNIFSMIRFFKAVEKFIENESMIGVFDYNWCGGNFGYGEPEWFGSHNISAEGQKFWNDSRLHDFSIPSNSVVREAGVDLSKRFTIDGESFDPLPGMEAGYFSGSRPDIGSPPFSNSDIEPPDDSQNPSVPTNLTYEVISPSQINLSWNASTDNVAVTGYNVYRNSNFLASTTVTRYTDTELSVGTTYTYTVSALDAAGNESDRSSEVTATVQSPSDDTEAPSVPQILSYQSVSSSQIDLVWDTATDNVGVAGYKIFRDGNQIVSTDNTSYSDTGLQQMTTYVYTILAYDAAGNESAQSNPVIVTTLSSDTTIVDLTIRTVPTRINLDGDLSEFVNADSAVFSPPSGGNTAIVKSMWDSQYLYIGYKVRDTQLNAEEISRDGDVWNDDAVEWFVDVKNDGGGENDPNSKYMDGDDFHGIINILNTQYDCCGSSDGTPLMTWNGSWESAVRLDGTLNNNTDYDDGYVIEVRIPWITFGLTEAPEANSTMSMSFSNVDRDASQFSYVMWPDITTAFQNASMWQSVLLVSSDDMIAPEAPIGLVVRLID
ncbi:MAG: DUF1565 domain-containing protein [candidate division Zixibacteria bacterium]|nr:DUF1565 domain-containing protein [candidate division Zixibacteria bacterium]